MWFPKWVIRKLRVILKKYNVKKCIYGHLHGRSHEEAVEGIIDGVEYIMASCDYLKFELKKIV